MATQRPTEHADGVLPGDVPAVRAEWFPIALVDVLRGGPVGFMLFGDEYVAWLDGTHRPVALPRRCPHRRADLVRGHVREQTIVCEYHGWAFGVDGRCVFVPQLAPGVPIPPAAHLAPLPARIEWGMVWVWGDPAAPPGPMPCWPEADDAAFDTFIDTIETWQASAFRVVDNLLDALHPAFVHASTFGDASAPLVDIRRVETTPTGVRSEIRERNAPAQTGSADQRTTLTETLGPFTVRMRAFTGPDGAAGAADFSLLTVAVPVDDTTTSYVRFHAADYRLLRRHDDARRFSASVLAEDRPVVEHLEQAIRLRPGAEVHLRLDQPTLAYRRYLSALIARDTPEPSIAGARR